MVTPAQVVRRSWSAIFEVYEHFSTLPSAAGQHVARLRQATCQHFSRSAFAGRSWLTGEGRKARAC
jgi:hypothetical protein